MRQQLCGYPKPSVLPVPPKSLLILGDSISVELFGGGPVPGTVTYPTTNFKKKIHAAYPAYNPKVFCGALGGTTSQDGAAVVASLLAGNPLVAGVLCSFGTNDVGHGLTTGQFQIAMETIITAVVGAGLPIWIPTIPWAFPGLYAGIPSFNTIITGTLWGLSGVNQGPDLYTLVHTNSGTWLNGDGIHLNLAGCDGVLDAWVTQLASFFP